MTDYSQSTEQEIVSGIVSGDISVKKYLYCPSARYLTGVCARDVIDPEDIRDVMQERFLRIFSAIGSVQYRGAGSLKGWVARIGVD